MGKATRSSAFEEVLTQVRDIALFLHVLRIPIVSTFILYMNLARLQSVRNIFTQIHEADLKSYQNLMIKDSKIKLV